MNITLNGEIKEINQPINLADLLEHFALPAERVAIELNKQVVRKKDWTATQINEADRIEVIHFVGGG